MGIMVIGSNLQEIANKFPTRMDKENLRVLMFGWEFPPHISGGLGTACHGLTMALLEEEVDVLFVVPQAHGDESVALIDAGKVVLEGHQLRIRKARKKKGSFDRIQTDAALSPYLRPSSPARQPLEDWRHNLQDSPRLVKVEDTVTGKKGFRYRFSGRYDEHLMEEVDHYAAVAAQIAANYDFDVIHAHDWLTYPAGIVAKEISGKPLVIHVHATEFDRAGTNIDQRVYDIEKMGMQAADRVVTVSRLTREIVADRYGIPPSKISVVHNGVVGKAKQTFSKLPALGPQVVTFLGRITHQKGPTYFIQAAALVHEQFPDAHFIMAGSGDLMTSMIEEVARRRLSSHFHFTGFLRGEQVDKIWALSSVYVMPSVSEPFGIAPLEAMLADVPVIISQQSGVAEIIPHAIKVDFWDVNALAGAIGKVLKEEPLARDMKVSGREDAEKATWSRAARKIKKVYHDFR